MKELKENLRSGLKVLNRLETRLDKTEGQVKEMKGDRRSGLKGLRMSLDGVRKYYGVQRRLIEQRLLVLESDRDGTETREPAGDIELRSRVEKRRDTHGAPTSNRDRHWLSRRLPKNVEAWWWSVT